MAATSSELEQPLQSSDSQEEQHPWDKFEKEESPNVFEHLHLAPDGGFSEVDTLYSPSRWVSAAMLIIFVLYNVEYISVLDIGFISDPDHVDGYTEDEMEDINACFYMTRSIYDNIFRFINYVQGETVIEVGSIKPVQVLGFLEFVGLLVYTFQGIIWLLRVAFKDGKKRWYAVADFFWFTLPVLSVYSAMKLLDSVVPTKLLASVSAALVQQSERKEKGASFALAWSPIVKLVVKTLVCFIVGFDMFLMKLRVVNTDAGHSKMTIAHISPCVLFLVQVLGVVQLGPFVRQRLFIFIFAGEDGVLQEEEKEVMDTWNALLARRIYREFNIWQFLAVMMSFSDEDFQKLVLNEDAAEHEDS